MCISVGKLQLPIHTKFLNSRRNHTKSQTSTETANSFGCVRAATWRTRLINNVLADSSTFEIKRNLGVRLTRKI